MWSREHQESTENAEELLKELLPLRPEELPEALGQKLEKQQECFRQDRAVFEDERKQLLSLRQRILHWSPPIDQRVTLNISGWRLEVNAHTVAGNPFFRALLSGSFAPPDRNGGYFIERDPKWAMAIIQYLQDGSYDLHGLNQRELGELRAEADFYMVSGLADRCAAGLGPFLYSTLLEIPASGNGVVFELLCKHDISLLHICFFPYTNSVEEIVIYHSEGGLASHNSSRWHRNFKGKMLLASALLCKTQFPQPLYLSQGRHTLSLHCTVNDSAVTYTARANVAQPCEHFLFGSQAGLKADPEVPHALNARFFVGKIHYQLCE
eukprot:NODE_2800_length_1087_cov_74.668750_g2670_i0.p1 GENE.NODE_2800_length_1087_cov_74.668750_g2670_i0~~NODE_2800_length_1087_cov_74.668750_g2670_i0.p1  ORF type:complete len:323 (-),score=82.82 NODE_2800_length_1087_cov_74.668750_g2670_i0:27-995(-)